MYGSVPSNPISDLRRRLFEVGGCARQLRQAEVQHLHPALGVTMMLAGLRSRCTTPRSCASSSAAATSLPSEAISFSGSGPAAMCCDSVWPGTYSMTRKSMPSLLSKS